MRTPCAPSTADASEIEPEEAEALASTKVHDSTLLLIDLDLQFSQLLPKTFFHRLHQPVMSRIGVDQDHQSSSGRESHPSALTEPDVKLAPHPAPTLQPPVARQAATGRTDWGPVARCIPANASMLVPGV